MPESTVYRARSRVGVAARLGDREAERLARRDLAAEKLAAYIKRTVDTAPPLTPAQRDKLTLLLQGGGSSA